MLACILVTHEQVNMLAFGIHRINEPREVQLIEARILRGERKGARVLVLEGLSSCSIDRRTVSISLPEPKEVLQARHDAFLLV